MKRIVKDQLVKIIAGNNRGKIGKVTRVSDNQVWVEGINNRERHVRATQYNPRGGKKDIQLPVDVSNVALVVENVKDAEKTSKISFQVKNGAKTRVAKLNNKEVK
ncbi:50S ribosomal protein L24 [Candidatus Saccharibacteria bacterium]|nr:50S ribosomal protein L24 [Candidatus Saccharibacteria bacterium]MCL1962678.1 50S ribosomal protein L24 [Candidatus Saccharibacteria bacterium]